MPWSTGFPSSSCKGNRGVSPHTPQGALPLDPFSGNCNSYQTNSFPVQQKRRTEIPSHRKIVFLRVGCGTATHGLGGGTPPAGCYASGENEKKPAGKFTFLTGFFLHFHSARGLSFRFLTQHAERSRKKQSSASQIGCRGNPPAVGVQGARSPLLGPFLTWYAEKSLFISFLYRRTGAGPMALLPGVQGAA